MNRLPNLITGPDLSNMNVKENNQKIDLIVTGSNAPVLLNIESPSHLAKSIRPTPPQGSRALHSARSVKISCKDDVEVPSTEASQLSFSATSLARQTQYIPISVILDADFPNMATRKESVIFHKRKEMARSLQNSPRLLTSRSCVEKGFSAEDPSKCEVPKKSFFQVDATSATISPRPPVARARSPTSIHSRLQSPRSARHIEVIDENKTADSAIHKSALISSLLLQTVTPSDLDNSKNVKRRFDSHELGLLETSIFLEESEDASQKMRHASFDCNHSPMMALSNSQIVLDISRAQKVGELENHVQNSMNQSQYNKNMRQSIVALAKMGTNSNLKFAFPHSSPAQLFIVSQPVIKLSETTISSQRSKKSAPATSMSNIPHPLPAFNTSHSTYSKSDSSTAAMQNASPKLKNTFIVQKNAFVLKNFGKSPRMSLPTRELQQPILFNHIGPYKQRSSVHDSRAADAAIDVLATTKPLQTQKPSAEHQRHHIMCNNRVPDFFLAAMHRK